MVMGCNESRQKEHPPINPTLATTFTVATPLPLHLYQEYTYATTPAPLQIISPPSSPTEKASPTSPTIKLSPSAKASPLAKTSPLAKAFFSKGMSTVYYAKLKSIAHYKFPSFKDFSSDVQEQILLHIDKELKTMQ
jgi:hypothetical protein